MLACVVGCSQICRARSTSRRTTGCEGNFWPAERDNDQALLIRGFSSSVGYSERSCTALSESGQCLDGACEKSDCIKAGNDGHESEDEGVENDTRRVEHAQEEQEGGENPARVIDSDHDRRLGGEAEVERTTPDLQLSSDTRSCRVSKSGSTSRMPAKSIERLQTSSSRTHLESADETLRKLTNNQPGSTSEELGPSLSVGFGEGASCVDHINNGGGKGKESQLAERTSRSHDFFRETLDVVGSRRDERSEVQLGLSNNWGDDLRGNQEQLSFQGADTVECITNAGEEDDFGFDVEFQTSQSEQKQDEPTQEIDSLSEFHNRGETSQGGQGRQTSPSPTFDNPQAQNEATLRTRAGSRLGSNAEESEDTQLPVETISAGRQIPERPEAGSGRVIKGQEKDLRGEWHLRKIEATLPSDERRVRARLDGPAASGKGEDTEEAKTVRPTRPSGGKDRHSKVNTAKGPRDRRVRLSVPTAVQFYDVQDRLGLDQPSKAVEWLIKKAKSAIDELGRLPARGNEGTSTLSDITHASTYSSSLGGPLSGSSSCPPAGSYSANLNSPFDDHVGDHMSYFIDSSIHQGVPFGSHSVHTRDVVGGMGLSQAHLVTSQGQLAGLSFPLGQTDLTRGSPCSGEGGKPREFTGRVESRYKTRERARERVKAEKGTGRGCGNVTGDGSSPTSSHSPPLHQNPIHSSFPSQNAMQSSVHSLSLQNPHPIQSSLSSVYDISLSGIMQNSQQGILQNLIMQNSSLQLSFTDQVQSSLHHPFQASFQSTEQLTSQSITSLQNPGVQEQSHLQRSSLDGSTQRALHLGSGFAPGPCSSSFSEATSLTSSDFMPVSVSELSSFGITSPSSMGPHFSTGSSAVQIPAGFSPGPHASGYRPRPMPSNQSCSKESQPHIQGLSGPQCQLVLPPYSSGHGLGSPGGSAGPKASSSLYYPPTSSRMVNLQAISPIQLESSAFSSMRNVGYDYQGLHMMSPGQGPNLYQVSSSQLQMPASIQGLDAFDDELTSSPQSSPRVHP